MLRPLADAALKRLASLLASYGLGLPELSPQQLSSLSTLLQLLQSSGERGTGTGPAGTDSGGCQGRRCRFSGRVLQDLCLSPFQVLLAPKRPQRNGWVCSRVVLEEVPRRRWGGCGCMCVCGGRGSCPGLSLGVPAPPFPSLQVTEGDMQHGDEPVPPSSTVPPPRIPTSSSPGDRPRGRAVSSPAPRAEPQRGHMGDTLSPGKPIAVEKKSYTEAKDGGVQRGTRPPDEYGYIVTDQK